MNKIKITNFRIHGLYSKKKNKKKSKKKMNKQKQAN